MLQKILIVSFLFSLINCTCASYLRDNSTIDYDYDDIFSSLKYKDSSASTKECKKRSFNEYEQNDNAYKCCYWKEKCTFKDNDGDTDFTTEFEGCSYLDKKHYDNIKDYIKEGKQYCSKIDVDCSGTSLSYAYLMLIILFLL